MSNSPIHIDIFCRVIDNYGDIGVCYRLAKCLLSDLSQSGSSPEADQIRLWVDDLHSFHKIAPSLDPHLQQQSLAGIEIRSWATPVTGITPATLSIEAFGAQLDEDYIHAMPGHTKCWLNLEYLSAESWVEDFHGLPSPQANGVSKYFFFPGFTAATGGLLREHDLLIRQANFLANRHACYDWLERHISPECAQAWQAGAELVSIFCYPHAPLEGFLRALATRQRPTLVLIPEGVAAEAEQILAQFELEHYLSIHRFSFLAQTQYDNLLALCQFNIVRGEDSFVRAIWSGQPFIWHIYPQQQQSHMQKLDAWLARSQCPSLYAQIMRQFNLPQPYCDLFTDLSSALVGDMIADQWQSYSHQYRQQLLDLPTLSRAILNFQQKLQQTG